MRKITERTCTSRFRGASMAKKGGEGSVIQDMRRNGNR
jgi:hypothetical protein